MGAYKLISRGNGFYLGTKESNEFPLFNLDIYRDITSHPISIKCDIKAHCRGEKGWLKLPFSNFKILDCIQGIQWRDKGFVEICELCARIKDTAKPEEEPVNLIFYEAIHSNPEKDIAKGIITFLNDLLRFQTVDDYKIWDSIRESSFRERAQERNGEKPFELDWEDKILKIADVIKLYKKYVSLNPVFTYKAELRKWISSNLKKLLTEGIN